MLASPPCGRLIFALGLCILAFSFAMEAKLAWYGSEDGPVLSVSAAKALPADIPSLVQHGASSSAPNSPIIPFFFFLLFVATHLFANLPQQLRRAYFHRLPAFAFCFSPQMYLRPPPAI
jgi:hypothetical protein